MSLTVNQAFLNKELHKLDCLAQFCFSPEEGGKQVTINNDLICYKSKYENFLVIQYPSSVGFYCKIDNKWQYFYLEHGQISSLGDDFMKSTIWSFFLQGKIPHVVNEIEPKKEARLFPDGRMVLDIPAIRAIVDFITCSHYKTDILGDLNRYIKNDQNINVLKFDVSKYDDGSIGVALTLGETFFTSLDIYIIQDSNKHTKITRMVIQNNGVNVVLRNLGDVVLSGKFA